MTSPPLLRLLLCGASQWLVRWVQGHFFSFFGAFGAREVVPRLRECHTRAVSNQDVEAHISLLMTAQQWLPLYCTRGLSDSDSSRNGYTDMTCVY